MTADAGDAVQMPGKAMEKYRPREQGSSFSWSSRYAPVGESKGMLPTDQSPESLEMEMNILKKAFLKGEICSKSELLKDNWGLCWFLSNLPFNTCSIFDPLGKYTTPSKTYGPK